MLVKLQRPPPEIRIFLPMCSACSSTATCRPRLPASMAQKSPAAPPPRMTTSNLWIIFARKLSGSWSALWHQEFAIDPCCFFVEADEQNLFKFLRVGLHLA